MKILVGISGGIAAYKSPDLVRRIKETGAEVRVVMTQAATTFISPLTMQAVSGHLISTDLLDPKAEAAMGHIELARWADLILIAPATADLIARIANGMANDLLSTICLATTSPVVIAPAMNMQMWANLATQDNVNKLINNQITILGPDKGQQACGETGLGRMLEPHILAAECAKFDPERQQSLKGIKVLVTAGPTQESIDPVRFLSNHSSGKMGFEIARAASRAGANVTLISGPVELDTLVDIKRIDVISAQQMYDQVHQYIDDQDIFIGCAAVADYKVCEVAQHKIKKNDQQLVLTMVENPDIISSVSSLAQKPYCVGFAAETQDILSFAKKKMETKNLDMICANDVSQVDIGFNSDLNKLIILTKDGEELALEKASKEIIAEQIITLIAEKNQFKG